jgi:NAD(P)-dependent dehydrogenase (short-subunit alcohol dehydrogenase family)
MVIRPVLDGPVLVTGAASGIGRAAALHAATGGAAVAAVDVDGGGARTTADAAMAAGARAAIGIECDLRDEAAVTDAFARTVEAVGTPAGVVCAAGIDRGGLAHELSAETWDEVVETNLRGTFFTCRAALRGFLAAQIPGSVVCVSSPLGRVAAPGGTSAYSASKAGISALVRTLAVDYAQYGIRVNAVLPGPTETALMWANVAPDDRAAMRKTIECEVPLGRLADPEEPANAILWLLSPQASYVTGSELACDGGILARAAISV